MATTLIHSSLQADGEEQVSVRFSLLGMVATAMGVPFFFLITLEQRVE